MDEHTLRVLEFYKVREVLKGYASSEPGRLMVDGVVPMTDPASVGRALRETHELRSYLAQRREFPISGLREVSSALTRAAVEGASLRPEELLDVLSVARTSRLVKAALTRTRAEYPLLYGRASVLGVFEAVESEVSRAIGGDGEVLDSASPELRHIRRSLALTRSRLNKELEGIIQDPAYSKAVQEPLITMRGERYVLALKPNFRLYIQGIVHDHSTSRSTVFVEPQKTVELNNRLAQLRVDEAREVERVLYELTAVVRGFVEGLRESFSGLALLDMIYAKASYAEAIGANMPALKQGGVVDLKDARHPLLIKAKGRDKTVPLDVTLGRDYEALVITGPNTGGKTVVLKTVGLLALMAQAGMLIPAGPDSELSVFDGIYSDIGDEQSIEQNLSTFSSHISQIVRILGGTTRESLVLLDELGAGTDPAEGSALGMAILDELHRRGSRVIVTTHHGALKVYAANTEGVMNASVEFDPETLMPTYRLLTGRPGRSNALVVAERLGMPGRVIQAATKTKGQDMVQLDSLIERLEREARAALDDRLKAAHELDKARAEKARLQELVRQAEDARVEAVRKAKEKSSNVLGALRIKMRELEEMGKRADMLNRSALKKVAEEVKTLEKGLEEGEVSPPEGRGMALDTLFVGDTVRVYKYKKLGKVLAVKKEKGQVVVQLDNMKLTLGPHELEAAAASDAKAPKKAARPSGGVTLTREEEDTGAGPGIEINVIGQRVEEALGRVEKFLDECLLAGVRSVRIIHGRGTGALRRAISESLATNSAVTSYGNAPFEEGGDAVTVVELRV